MPSATPVVETLVLSSDPSSRDAGVDTTEYEGVSSSLIVMNELNPGVSPII